MFLPVKRYEWIYEFNYKSNIVRSVTRYVNRWGGTKRISKWIILLWFIGEYWHIYYDLYLEWKKEKTSMHRIVAEYYQWRIPEKMEVCHIDWDPKNNYPDNLRIDTHQSNMQDMAKHGRCRATLWKTWIKSKLSKNIIQLSIDWVFIKKHFWTMDVKRDLWYDPSAISKACRWILSTSYWFLWRYE